MLAAVAALDHGQNERAPDAHGRSPSPSDPGSQHAPHLIGRTTPQPARRCGLRPHADPEDSQARRKTRKRPRRSPSKSNRLAQDEDFVYATLGGVRSSNKERGQGEPGRRRTRRASPEDDKRREATARQEQIVDKLAELEEKLKKLETSSDLAKVRMANAAETAQKASGALARGNTSEATESRQGGCRRSSTSWRGRSRASLLAKSRPSWQWPATWPTRLAETGSVRLARCRASHRHQGRGPGPGASKKASRRQGARAVGRPVVGVERLDRSRATRTVGRGGQDSGALAERRQPERGGRRRRPHPRTGRGERGHSGRRAHAADRRALTRPARSRQARRDAKELSRSLEMLARQLDSLYRGIIAPELAKPARH